MPGKKRDLREDDPHVFGGRYGPPKLEDESRFHVIKRVPIIDKHEHPSKGNVDEKLLKLLVKNSNKRAKRGEYAKVMIGHTKTNADEKDQPTIVGFAKNFQIGTYKGVPCSFADFHVRTHKLDDMLEYPFRSIERWDHPTDPDGNYIPAIAVLKTDPERDLGLLTYAKSGPPGARLVCYGRDMGPVLTSKRKRPMPDTKALSKIFADCISAMSAALSEMHAMDGGDADDVLADEDLEGAAMGEDAALADDDDMGGVDLFTGEGSEAQDQDDMEGQLADELDSDEPEEEEPEKYAKCEEEPKMVKNSAAASGTNTFVPSPVKGKKKESYSKDAPSNLAKDPLIKQMAADIKALKLYNKSLQTYSKALEVKDARKEVLDSLVQNEGYQIDVKDELEFAKSLDDAAFESHLGRIRKNYSKSPAGDGGFIQVSAPPRPGDDEITNDDVPRLVEYCMGKGVNMSDTVAYERAMKSYVADRKAGTLIV